MDQQLRNVTLLGIGFHLVFLSFLVTVNMQQTVINGLDKRKDNKFSGSGYVAQCIVYASFALSNWFAPSIIAILGRKWSMFISALGYGLYPACLINPQTLVFYLGSALVGISAGVIWTAQGSFLAAISSPDTRKRNTNLFWVLFQTSCIVGNSFIYFLFDNKSTLSDGTRYIFFASLSVIGCLGSTMFPMLRDKPRQQDEEIGSLLYGNQQVTAKGQFITAFRLVQSRDMIFLSIVFIFTGILLSFFSGIYETAIGATREFGVDSKKYIGLSGIFLGLGEITGGALFGLNLLKITRRNSIFMLGYIIMLAGLGMAFMNLPPDASLVPNPVMKPIIKPNIWVALISVALVGFADSCFITQIYALLMCAYEGDASAFALFKFFQAIGTTTAFLYSSVLDLQVQIYIMVFVGSIACLSFLFIDWEVELSTLQNSSHATSSNSTGKED